MFNKPFRPEVFQGNLKKNNYFEGWYYKHVSGDQNHVYSFIPGVSLTKNNPHAFIQVINGITGKTNYITYPLEEFTGDRNRLFLKIGNSVFSEKSISLDIKSENLNVTGELLYSNIVKYPKTLFSPGIMGWYSFIPFMECKHGIISVNHDIKGNILINNDPVNFDGGKGYIEKDWGSSFPEAWIWIQANSFKDQNSCFTFSVAKIPWMGKFFIGFISFLYYNNEFYLFSTYNNSSITEINHDEDSVNITMKNQKSILKVSAVKNTFGELMAPVTGTMSRRIKESVDSQVKLQLYDRKNNLIYMDVSNRAGLEIIEKIFEYFRI